MCEIDPFFGRFVPIITQSSPLVAMINKLPKSLASETPCMSADPTCTVDLT